jgi:hypothetical protein
VTLQLDTLDTVRSTPDRVGEPPLRWRAGRRERRRLARQDRLTANLAELHHIQTLLAAAADVICSGWVQNGWFTYRDEHAQQHTVGTHELRLLADRPITGACLVGAIVTAGGGPSAAGSQPVQRALDLTWHTLYGGYEPIRWCPAPSVRTSHMCDLTRWNDQPDRTPEEVAALLQLTSCPAWSTGVLQAPRIRRSR